MSIIITIIVFFLIFSLLILIHEFGHFYMARRAGIKVEEFGFGLPPRAWGKKFKKNGTLYSINWIPFGGFVRLYGEDSTDPKMLKSKKSFAGKPMRKRVAVIVAGVVMNFLLAWLLIWIGFTVGMEPLLGPNDILPSIDDGTIVLEEGVIIGEVREDSLAEELGISAGDVIYTFDGQEVNGEILLSIAENPVGEYEVVRNGEVLSYEVVAEALEGRDDEGLGLMFSNMTSFPRVKIFDVAEESDSYKFGLRPGDVVLSVNEREVFNVSDFEEKVRGEDNLEYLIYRDGLRETVIVEVEQGRRVIASGVLPGSPAWEVGLHNGDVIVAVNGNRIADSQQLIDYVGVFADENPDQSLAYLIERGGEQLFFEITPKDGKIGVLLSELFTFGANEDLSVYNVNLLSSIVEIRDQQYPVHVAFYKSFGETVRLGKLTFGMFGDFIQNLVMKGEVPESVAGPVGIAQLTHNFVQEGLIPVLRFVAILSLSLAVLNILPFPALDGGRLLFIIIEFVMGRPVNQKWEAAIHGIGYLLILLLILAVTYSDIVRLVAN